MRSPLHWLGLGVRHPLHEPEELITLLLVIKLHHIHHLNLFKITEEVADDGAGARWGFPPLLGEDICTAHGAGAVVASPLDAAAATYLVSTLEGRYLMRLAWEGLITYGALNVWLWEVNSAHLLPWAGLVSALASLLGYGGALHGWSLYTLSTSNTWVASDTFISRSCLKKVSHQGYEAHL